MKKLLIILVFFILSCNPKTKKYTGRVIEKFTTQSTKRHHSYSILHVVFYSNELKRNIDVSVTYNCYANVKIGNTVCFELTDYDLHR